MGCDGCNTCEYKDECKNVKKDPKIGDYVEVIHSDRQNHSIRWCGEVDSHTGEICKITRIKYIPCICGKKQYDLDVVVSVPTSDGDKRCLCESWFKVRKNYNLGD